MWYNQQAFRALNQALGRCIRHKFDYGCIIFLESRFYGNSNYSKNNVCNLSKWIRPCFRYSPTVQSAVKQLIKPYFDYMAVTPPRRVREGEIAWKPPFKMPQNPWSRNCKNAYNMNLRQNNNALNKNRTKS